MSNMGKLPWMQEYSRVTEKMKNEKSLCLLHPFSSCPPLSLSFSFFLVLFLPTFIFAHN